MGGLSLDEVVKDLINYPELVPQNRRTSEGRLSENNSSYNAARQRLPLQVTTGFCQRVCDYLAKPATPAFEGRRVFILDGTTITLPPTAEHKTAFPPAPNQHGESVWPVAMLLVAHELQTGCAMVPQIDPMYGQENSSESKQAERAIAQPPDNSIVMADSGFGIFSVAHTCQRYGQQFLFRLTKQRYQSHSKKAKLVREGRGYRTAHMVWTPSAKERRNHPTLPAEATIEAFIHQIELPNGETLELITNLEPRRLSFQGVWTTFKWDLLFKEFSTASDATLAYQHALISAAGRRLPNRQGRSYPRIAHTRRQKSTKFQIQQRKINASKTDKPPPD